MHRQCCTQQEDDDVQGGDGRKLSKAQKRKIAKAKADAEREIRIAQEKSELGDSEKTIEEQVCLLPWQTLQSLTLLTAWFHAWSLAQHAIAQQ